MKRSKIADDLTYAERVAQAALRGFFGDPLGFTALDTLHKRSAKEVEKVLEAPPTSLDVLDTSANTPAIDVPSIVKAVIALYDTFRADEIRAEPGATTEELARVVAWDRVRAALQGVPREYKVVEGNARFPIA